MDPRLPLRLTGIVMALARIWLLDVRIVLLSTLSSSSLYTCESTHLCDRIRCSVDPHRAHEPSGWRLSRPLVRIGRPFRILSRVGGGRLLDDPDRKYLRPLTIRVIMALSCDFLSDEAYFDFASLAGPLSPPRPPSGPSRSTSGYSYRTEPAPRGPASSTAPIRQPAGPGLATNGFDRSRRDATVGPHTLSKCKTRADEQLPRPRSPPRRPENQAPVPSFVARGPNQAPMTNNRWGANSASATPPARPHNSLPAASSRNEPSRPAAQLASSAAEDERARLLAKKKKAQEELEEIRREEERLEKLDAEKKRRDEIEAEKLKREAEDKRREEDRRRSDRPPMDDRRREFDDRRREWGGEREDPRRYRPAAGARVRTLFPDS